MIVIHSAACVSVLCRFNVLSNIDFKNLYYVRAPRRHGLQIKNHGIVSKKRHLPQRLSPSRCVCVCRFLFAISEGACKYLEWPEEPQKRAE